MPFSGRNFPAAAGGGERGTTMVRLLSASSLSALREAAFCAFRAVFGLMVFFIHGVHKVMDVVHYLKTGATSKFLDEVAAMGIPAPMFSAGAAAVVQLLGGLLLAVGFATRFAGAALAAALLGAVAQNLLSGRDPQLAALYTLVAATFALTGGSRYSVDAVLFDNRGTPHVANLGEAS